MPEYIEREAVLALLEDPDRLGYLDASDIKSVPAVDVSPVAHGRWRKSRIPVPVYGGIEISCSSCGRIAAHEYNYCPNCGARMDGET